MVDKLKRAFWKQKDNATQRGIPFQLTYDQWLTIWVASGKLYLRGRTHGQFIMARKGDRGGYQIGNVEIMSVESHARSHVNNMSRPKYAAWLAASNKGRLKGSQTAARQRNAK
jgi:hypothetical protein